MSSSFPGPLTEKEEQYYVQQLEQNDPDARRILIERNLRLVAHIARKYISPGTCQDDLISIGTIGLIKAVNTYTAARSARLATYAAKCIENAILSQMRLWFRLIAPRKLLEAQLFNQQYQNYEDIPNVQDRLRWCRHHMGLMQKEVAELIGITRGHYIDFEVGYVDPNLLRAWDADQKRMNINSWEKYFKNLIKA